MTESPLPSTTAAELPPEAKEEKPKDRSAYVSISPLHLLFPIVEVTAEFENWRRIRDADGTEAA